MDDYVYLRKLVSFEANSNENAVDRRINTTWKKRNTGLRRKSLKETTNLNMKKIIMDSCILPGLTHASHTWVYTEKIKNKILFCQHAMERSILKLRRIQKTRNTDIRKKTKISDARQYS